MHRTRLFVLALLAVGLISLFGITRGVEAGPEHNVLGYAWSSNIGWISFNCENTGSCAGGNYGVSLSTPDASGNRTFSGYAWANPYDESGLPPTNNIGWVSFQPADLAGCPDGNCVAQVRPDGTAVGWARFLAGENPRLENVPTDAGMTQVDTSSGWDGWIKLSGTAANGSQYGAILNATDKKISGFSWADDTVGWVQWNPDNGVRLRDDSTTLTAQKRGNAAASGTIISTPAGITCGTNCSFTFAQNQAVTLDSSVTAGVVFAGFSQNCPSLDTDSCRITVAGPTTVYATYFMSEGDADQCRDGDDNDENGTIDETGGTIQPGDFDQNGLVTLADSVICRRYVGTNDYPVTLFARIAGNLDGNPSSFTLADCTEVDRILRGDRAIPAAVTVPADDSCTTGREICGNNIDDDGDGLVDEDCICDDGVDNDGDGLIDAADPNCVGENPPGEMCPPTGCEATLSTGVENPRGTFRYIRVYRNGVLAENCFTMADCSNLPYRYGDHIRLIGSTGSADLFDRFTAPTICSGGTAATTCEFVMARDTANFGFWNEQLVVTKPGDGTGTITTTPPGISCGSDCNENYDYNELVTLVASPAAGSRFSGWGGDASICGTALTCQIRMTGNRQVTATFEQNDLLPPEDSTCPPANPDPDDPSTYSHCARCNDGVDNDRDGTADWNGADGLALDRTCGLNPNKDTEGLDQDVREQ